jgi:hypothetical protein
LGRSGLRVSPICLGITESADTVLAAYEAGVNFFFISADLHWPMYEPTREGLRRLLEGNASRRDDLVVAVVSYLEEPLFRALQFNEVIDAVPGLERVDLLLAGAISSDFSFFPRIQSLTNARFVSHLGAAAIGASFHQRTYALLAANNHLLDIVYTRYNALHPGARQDLFPYFQSPRSVLNYNFKSTMPYVSKERFTEMGFTKEHWFPEVGDHYRFVMTHPEVDGMLCSPASPDELKSLVTSLDKGPLRVDEEDYLISLSSVSWPKIFS